MFETNWRVDGEHIRLHYRRFPVSREIWLNGQTVFSEKGFFDRGSRAYFVAGERELEFASVVVNGGLTRHFLLQQGQPIPSEEEEAAGIDQEALLKDAGMGHAHYWRQLTRLTQMHYLPQRDTHFWYRHRLVGRKKERLLSLRLDRPAGSRVMVSLIAHFPPKIADETAFKRALLSDPQMTRHFGDVRNLPDKIGVAPAHIGLALPYQPQTTSPEALAAKIDAFAGIVAAHTDPLPEDWCAESLSYRAVKVASLNGFPIQIGQELLAERQQAGTALLTVNQESGWGSPFSMLIGLLVGLIIGFGWLYATLALAGESNSRWAVAAVVIPPIGGAIIARLLHTLNDGRTPRLWGVAALASGMGALAAMIWGLGQGDNLAGQGFSRQAINGLPLYGALAIGFALWYGWRGLQRQREELNRLYAPQIEILELPA